MSSGARRTGGRRTPFVLPVDNRILQTTNPEGSGKSTARQLAVSRISLPGPTLDVSESDSRQRCQPDVLPAEARIARQDTAGIVATVSGFIPATRPPTKQHGLYAPTGDAKCPEQTSVERSSTPPLPRSARRLKRSSTVRRAGCGQRLAWLQDSGMRVERHVAGDRSGSSGT